MTWHDITLHTLHTLHTLYTCITLHLHLHSHLHYITLHLTALHYITLHYITSHHITLHTYICVRVYVAFCMCICIYIIFVYIYIMCVCANRYHTRYNIIQLCRGPTGLIPGVGQRSSRCQTRISGRDAFLTYLQFRFEQRVFPAVPCFQL